MTLQSIYKYGVQDEVKRRRKIGQERGEQE